MLLAGVELRRDRKIRHLNSCFRSCGGNILRMRSRVLARNNACPCGLFTVIGSIAVEVVPRRLADVHGIDSAGERKSGTNSPGSFASPQILETVRAGYSSAYCARSRLESSGSA